MDDSEFASLAPIYGFIFLFKWTQEMAKMHTSSATCVEHHNLYFAKQVINNACGTQVSSPLSSCAFSDPDVVHIATRRCSTL